MNTFLEAILKWESSLCEEINHAALFSRNPEAHKWKLLYRIIILRELVSWRLIDLLKQAVILTEGGYMIGARIILRSSIETLGLLIYSSQKMESVYTSGKGFHELSDATSKLLLGSRNCSTKHQSINVLTVLGKCEKKYEGIMGMYEDLSESSHPNWEGMFLTYSKINHESSTTYFGNRSHEIYLRSHEPILKYIMYIFETEYNSVWPETFEKFECWVAENSKVLEEDI